MCESVEKQNVLLPFKACLFCFLMGMFVVCAMQVYTVIYGQFLLLLNKSWAQTPPVYQLH